MRRGCKACVPCAVWVPLALASFANNAAVGSAAAALSAHDNALLLRRSAERGRNGGLQSSWRQRSSLRGHATMSPAECKDDEDQPGEYCPASDSCVQDCGLCTGYTIANKNANQCMPQFVFEHCGETPSTKCFTFAAGMMDCISGCSSTVQYDLNAGAMGSCISGLNGNCPAAVCTDICNCKDGSCDEPCFSTCNKYKDCVLFGNGVQASASAEFTAFYNECVLGKDPPAGYQAADCGCRAT
mmetsp:Transcript_148958/g.270744  ORF Transcript_148958/g.270744 Transcript_148958/m.270744 type:complete len:242 (+) Transcript_148958:21-746(+)